jgi:hypothetical protein
MRHNLIISHDDHLMQGHCAVAGVATLRLLVPVIGTARNFFGWITGFRTSFSWPSVVLGVQGRYVIVIGCVRGDTGHGDTCDSHVSSGDPIEWDAYYSTNGGRVQGHSRYFSCSAHCGERDSSSGSERIPRMVDGRVPERCQAVDGVLARVHQTVAHSTHEIAGSLPQAGLRRRLVPGLTYSTGRRITRISQLTAGTVQRAPCSRSLTLAGVDEGNLRGDGGCAAGRLSGGLLLRLLNSPHMFGLGGFGRSLPFVPHADGFAGFVLSPHQSGRIGVERLGGVMEAITRFQPPVVLMRWSPVPALWSTSPYTVIDQAVL